MAVKKYRVIGFHDVNGAKTGEEVELDDEKINVTALIQGGHVTEMQEPPKPSRVRGSMKEKGDSE